MSLRSQSAATGAAEAAPAWPEDFDRYLLVDDSVDDVTEILTILHEQSRPLSEVLS